MSSNREGNDRKRSSQTWDPAGPRRPSGPRSKARRVEARDWVWGPHAVEAALANPNRPKPGTILATEERFKGLKAPPIEVTIVTTDVLSARLPQGAVHQGIAIQIPAPEPVSLQDLAESGAATLLMLDQVTDPQNVGAIFRSAAAFGIGGIILQDRNCPPLSGALAKAAAGGLDRIPHCMVTNLSRAIEQLTDLGWRAVGLDGEGEVSLEESLDERPTLLILGSEGEGLRRLVAEHCDILARIDMPGGLESLNVSAAAAVSLYVVTCSRKTRSGS